MFVLSLIALILAILGVVAGLLFFNDYCQNKFGHVFLTKTMCFVTAAVFACLLRPHVVPSLCKQPWRHAQWHRFDGFG